MTDRTIEECAKIAESHVGAGVSGQRGLGYDEACRDIAGAIRAMVVPQPMTLWGQIAAVYGNLDAEDCAWVDREWMKMRKIATEPAVSPQDGWQPIETAPKEGSEILILTSAGVTQARFSPGEWHDYQEGREYDGPVWVCCDDKWLIEIEDCGEHGMNHGTASHWMPLPALPRAERSGDGK